MTRATDLLYPVDWANHSLDEPKPQPTPSRPLSEVERVARLVLNLEQHVDADPKSRKAKAINKIIRMALREIQQAVIVAEQDIDYENE